MKITKHSQAIHTDKAEGSSVDYYIFPEYELHYNEIKPGTVQHWHHHNQIAESIYVLAGTIEAHWVDAVGVKQKAIVTVGDVVEVENSPHTFINRSKEVVKFIVFRFVPTGEDQRELIKNDKVLDQELEK